MSETSSLTVGLFGTCGGSRWRDPFMREYDNREIAYYNPQVEDWKPEYADIEAQHLANDPIILFPVTGETYGTGSLSETGFSILNALDINYYRDVVVMIDPNLDESLDDPVARRESLRARKLVKSHLAQQCLKGLYIVNSLDDMLGLSLELHDIARLRAHAERW